MNLKHSPYTILTSFLSHQASLHFTFLFCCRGSVNNAALAHWHMNRTLQRTALCPLVPTLAHWPWNASMTLIASTHKRSPLGGKLQCLDENHAEKERKWGMCVTIYHLYDCCWLFPLLHNVQFGSAVSLIVFDVNGDPRGLQPLEMVTLAATPLIDVLRERKTGNIY